MAQAESDARAAGAGREGGIQAARDCFYKGDPARRMVAALKEIGGLYEYEDFAEYESPFEEPISVDYRGYTIYTNRTWTQGMALLQTLSILEGVDLAALGHNSPEAIHVQVEALKLAMADRERYAGDPAFVDVPFDGLLSPRYGALRLSLLDRNRAQAEYPPGDPRAMRAAVNGAGVARVVEAAGEFDGTTYLSTADTQGNMVSATPSSFAGLAQGMVLGDTGIVINCRGCYFWLDADNPNALAPRKRPRTTPCTFIVLKDGKPLHDAGHTRWRQSGAEQPSGVHEHRRLRHGRPRRRCPPPGSAATASQARRGRTACPPTGCRSRAVSRGRPQARSPRRDTT